jgi:hypothetical protein
MTAAVAGEGAIYHDHLAESATVDLQVTKIGGVVALSQMSGLL